jgi:PREDICTED: hypothetical protein|nr:MAG TPA: Insulin-like growth factor 1 receptor tyrosine kinase, Type 1 [Caudoviricetes sp.]
MRFVKNNEQVWVHTIVYGRNRSDNTPILFLCVDRQFSHPLFKLRDKAESLSHIFNKHNDQQNYFVYTVEYPIQRGVLRQVNNNTVSFDNFTYTDENDITFTFRSYQVSNSYKKRTITTGTRLGRKQTTQVDNNYTYSLQRYWNIEMDYFDNAVDWWLPYTQGDIIQYGGVYINKNKTLIEDLNSLNYNKLGSLMHRSDKELTIKYLNTNFLKDFQKVGKNNLLKITFFKQNGLEEQIYSVRDGKFNDVSSIKYPNEKTIKFELSYNGNVIFRYEKPFTYARIIKIEKNNLNGGDENLDDLEYGIFIDNGNINIDRKGVTSLKHAKISGSAVFNDLQVEIPRRVVLNFFDSNQRLIQYSGEWDLSGDLVLNTGCQGNCSGGCLGSCSTNCGSNCGGGCTGCSSCGGCDSR